MTPEFPEPPGIPELAQPPAEFPDDAPFWGYQDLAIFIGLLPLCMIAGALIAKSLMLALHATVLPKAAELLPAQFAGYGLLFGALAWMFRVQYGRPFWKSLAWTRFPTPLGIVVSRGVVLAFVVVLLGAVLRVPEVDSPIKQLLKDRTSMLLVVIAGTTIGPVCEELAFRGFMQTLFVRSLGAVPGVLLAGFCFGLLHLPQYGFSWRHALLITVAGAAFGWMRHASRSTAAAALMHASYNLTLFLGALAAGKDMPKTW
ncbi:MAG: lysostaphin resistance A-like protein [Bryobacteraceae bacterium]